MDAKETEVYELSENSDTLLKKFNELQENRQLNGIRTTTHEQDKKFNTDIATVKKNKNRHPKVEKYSI